MLNQKGYLVSRLQTYLALKTQLPCMSYERLKEAVVENPLIRVEALETGLVDIGVDSGIIQENCVQINAQPNVIIPSFPAILNGQQMARNASSHWLGTLLPRVLNTATQVKQFSNLVLSLGPGDIDEVLANLHTPEGKATFRNLMGYYQTEANSNQSSVIELMGLLNRFSEELDEALEDFRDAKIAVDNQYTGEAGLVVQLQETMRAQEVNMQKLNQEIIGLSWGIGIGAFVTVVGIFLWPISSVFVLLGIATVIGTSVALAILKRRRDEAAQSYIGTAQELYNVQAESAYTQVLSDGFDALVESNQQLAASLSTLIQAWHGTEDHYSSLAILVEEEVDQATIAFIRESLMAARENAEELKKIAEEVEIKAVLPVQIDNEEVLKQLRLPSSLIGRSIESSVFQFYTADRKRFDRYSIGPVAATKNILGSTQNGSTLKNKIRTRLPIISNGR